MKKIVCFLAVACLMIAFAVGAGCVSKDDAAAYDEMLAKFPGTYDKQHTSKYVLYNHTITLKSDGSGEMQEIYIGSGAVEDRFPLTWRGTGYVDDRIHIKFADDFAKIFDGYYKLSTDGNTLTSETGGDTYNRV